MRKKRQESSTGIYHVMSRGNDRMNIFHQTKDYEEYLTDLKENLEKQEGTVFAWCLMTNHVHLLVKADYDKLSAMMKATNSNYAGWYNSGYNHVGHVFQSRFKSKPVESERQLMVVFRYILRNPIKAHLENELGLYRWSSYRAYEGEDDGITSCEMMLDVFNGIDSLMEFSRIDSLDAGLTLLDHGDWMGMNELEELLGDYLLRKSGCRDMAEFKALPVDIQVRYCEKAKEQGFTYTMCQKVTGMSEYAMRSARARAGDSPHSVKHEQGTVPGAEKRAGDSPHSAKKTNGGQSPLRETRARDSPHSVNFLITLEVSMKKYQRLLTLNICLAAILLAGCGTKGVTVAEFFSKDKNAASETVAETADVSESSMEESEAADASESSEESEEVAEETEEQETEEEPTETFVFVDTDGEPYPALWYKTWPQNDYDWDALSGHWLEKTYTDEKYQSRLGIDVAKYQDEIDWEAAKNAGIEFAIIRIGYRGYGEEGTLNADPMFENHFSGAKAAGVDVGIYFFSQAVNEAEAREEAEYVLELLGDRELDMPIYFDEEDITEDTARTDMLSAEQFTANAVTFCETIEEAGYEAGFYANTYWDCLIYNQAKLADYSCWLSDYSQEPQTPYAFDTWQFTMNAEVPGVDGECDLNIQFLKG